MNRWFTNRYVYGPYGEPLHYDNEKERQGFIGKERDLESGLADHGVRKYDYISGRFTSVDPLSEKFIGMSPYNYSENNPINFLDDNGKFKISQEIRENYPKLVNIIENQIPSLVNNDKIMKELSKASNSSLSEIKHILNKDSGPLLTLDILTHANAMTISKTNTILSLGVVEDFNKNEDERPEYMPKQEAYDIFMIILLLHETVQSASYGKLNKSNENKGEKFEKSVFGKTINSVGDVDMNFDNIIKMINLY